MADKGYNPVTSLLSSPGYGGHFSPQITSIAFAEPNRLRMGHTNDKCQGEQKCVGKGVGGPSAEISDLPVFLS